MSHPTLSTDRKPCALETAQRAGVESSPGNSPPCALLCADQPDTKKPAAAPPVPAPREDESADPVGDGHSDAEWAERHPKSD